MYLIYQFFSVYLPITPGTVSGSNVWVVSASCTNQTDAELQVQRFLVSGVNANCLQLQLDSQSAPTASPLA